MNSDTSYSLFSGTRRLAHGTHAELLATIASQPADGPTLLVFADADGRQTELGELPAPRGPGRPRLGVTAREVTLLPRHWDWLGTQSGGASVALRKLVESASRSDGARARAAQEAAYRFITAIAGDLPGYEEALRALFAGDRGGFSARILNCPEEIQSYALFLAGGGR
jgi:hypothetical protein